MNKPRIRWRRYILNSKDLVILNPGDIDWEKIDKYIYNLNEQYSLYCSEISAPMMEGIIKFISDCKSFNSINDEIVLRYDVYCRMLRWLITENNPKYLSIQFEEFRQAMRSIWIYFFGYNFHKFRYPLPNKRYIDNRDEWNEWFKSIGGIEI